MPKFWVRKWYEFNAGTVNGSTESPPKDLLVDGRLVPLAQWPRDGALEVMADDDREAFEQANAQYKREGCRPWLRAHVTEERFQELKVRLRPGSDGRLTSVMGTWLAKPVGEPGDLWVLVAHHPMHPPEAQQS